MSVPGTAEDVFGVDWTPPSERGKQSPEAEQHIAQALLTLRQTHGHPRGKNIGHWIVGHGYNGYGSTLHFTDPSTSVFTSVRATFSMSVEAFHKFVTTNGIVA